MTIPHSVCEVLREQVVLKSEWLDRMVLNVYGSQPQLRLRCDGCRDHGRQPS